MNLPLNISSPHLLSVSARDSPPYSIIHSLADAYGHTAQLCIDAAVLRELIPTRLYLIQYDYNQENLINSWKNHFLLIEKESGYLEKISITFACPAEKAEEFKDNLQKSEHLITFFEDLGSSFEIR